LTAGAAAQARAGSTDIAAVDLFIDAPRAILGKTRGEIERTLGAPLAVRSSVAGAVSSPPPVVVDELDYPGLIVRVHPTSALASVAVTAPGLRLPHGLDIGAARTRVEAALGEPTAQADTRAMYLYSDGYPDTVKFHFRDGAIIRIDWTYGSTVPSPPP